MAFLESIAVSYRWRLARCVQGKGQQWPELSQQSAYARAQSLVLRAVHYKVGSIGRLFARSEVCSCTGQESAVEYCE